MGITSITHKIYGKWYGSMPGYLTCVQVQCTDGQMGCKSRLSKCVNGTDYAWNSTYERPILGFQRTIRHWPSTQWQSIFMILLPRGARFTLVLTCNKALSTPQLKNYLLGFFCTATVAPFRSLGLEPAHHWSQSTVFFSIITFLTLL